MKVKVKLRKNDTGEEFVYCDPFNYQNKKDYTAIDSILYGWLEGNDSCDCNRELFYCRTKGIPEPSELRCGDEKRFSLISITDAETSEIIHKPLTGSIHTDSSP